MKTITSLSCVVALALAGCADHSVAGDDDGGGGDGMGSQEETPPERQMDAQGTYRLQSTFDIATNMPGTAGSVLNGLISATDDPDDPMSWVLDQMLAQMDDGTLKDILVGAKPLVAGYLNDRLHDLAPGLVDTITGVGQRMGDLTKHFGLREKLEINSVDQTYIARVTADGVHWDVEGTSIDLGFVENNIDEVYADSVYIAYEKSNSTLQIGEHTLPLPYGKLVRLALDNVVVPEIDPTAHSLVELLDHQVNCAGVGQAVVDYLGFGSATFFATVCHSGLQTAANYAYDQIAAQNAVLDMHLMGTSRAADTNDDYKLDKLTFGTWSGSLTYEATDATLAQPATYHGGRL
jgi:hypothetical protein